MNVIDLAFFSMQKERQHCSQIVDAYINEPGFAHIN